MKYGWNDKPGWIGMLLYGLQWWVVSLPCVIIMGVVVARLQYTDLAQQTLYMQKLFALTGIATIVQVVFGHRMPLVVGPASTLLVGIIAASASSIDAVYTSIVIGGALLALAAITGLIGRLRFFFTPRIIAVILILIAFTLSPTILRLVFQSGEHTAFHFAFSGLAVLALIVCNAWLPGIWKSLTVLIGLAGGTFVYFGILGFPVLETLDFTRSPGVFLINKFELHPGTLLSFLFCFLALLINELGSIESIGHMLRLDGMDKRIAHGVGIQGMTNMAAGAVGVIGPVDFSLSAGVIAATGCASRYTLIPAGIGLFLCGLFPTVVHLLSCIPGPVMGMLMLYLMASQLSSGLSMLVAEKGVHDFNSGMIVGLPLMIGLIIAFTPASVFSAFPDLFRPIIANGFVMGTITVIILEHLVFRHQQR